MALLRLTFTITRKPTVPPQMFENLICEPALELDLAGRFQYEGNSTFTVTMEGPRRNVQEYRTYIEVGNVAFGATSHFTEFSPSSRVFGDSIAVDYRIARRGTQREVNSDVDM